MVDEANEQEFRETILAYFTLWQKVDANGMTEEEFQLTRAFLSKYYLHFAETTQMRLGYAVDDAFYGLDGKGHLEQFGEMMASITREEVNAALRKHLQSQNPCEQQPNRQK